MLLAELLNWLHKEVQSEPEHPSTCYAWEKAQLSRWPLHILSSHLGKPTFQETRIHSCEETYARCSSLIDRRSECIHIHSVAYLNRWSSHNLMARTQIMKMVAEFL